MGYFERDGYYAKDDGAHREASAWAGRGAEGLGLEGPVDPEAFRRVLEGEVPGGRRLGRREPDGTVKHRPGRDVTLSAPKSVSLMAKVGGDERIVEAHDKAVGATPAGPSVGFSARTCSRRRWRTSRARSRSRRRSGRLRRSNATARSMPRPASTTEGTGPPTRRWHGNPRPSR